MTLQCVGCENHAVVVYGGYSFCPVHLQEYRQIERQKLREARQHTQRMAEQLERLKARAG